MTKQRCFNCNKKTGIMVFSCKCVENFCSKCRYPEEHLCKFDYKNYEKNLLKKRLVKVVAKKIEII